MLSLPFLIGYDYFMWVDEPPLGVVKGFMENSNYGLVSEDGKPYAELTQAFAALHRDPVAARLRPPPMRRAQSRRVSARWRKSRVRWAARPHRRSVCASAASGSVRRSTSWSRFAAMTERCAGAKCRV